MSRRIRTLCALSAALLLVASACSDDDDDDAADTTPVAAEETTAPGEVETTAGGTLQEVLDRGSLNCGTNGQLAGFSLNENGVYSGFDVDFCRAIAAAVLGDSEAVTYTDLTADTRFTALQSGEIDVLIRNGTWTASRDGGLGLQWSTTTFYDGQGMLVLTDSEFETLDDMQNTVICVQSGTTTELNLATVFAARGITYEPLLLPDEESIASSFNEGACDGYTTDKSGLASFRATYPDGPEAVRIMDETMSKEPLGPAVRQGDDEWFDIVNWVTLATIQAEEFGLTSANIGTAATDFADNPEILRFIGVYTGDDAEFDAGLNLPPDFAVRVVQAVGNYSEIYERNITPLGLERGLNNLWNAEEPGLLYSPPYR
jgi:general L-amino acid transport system substrate-binding protein